MAAQRTALAHALERLSEPAVAAGESFDARREEGGHAFGIGIAATAFGERARHPGLRERREPRAVGFVVARHPLPCRRSVLRLAELSVVQARHLPDLHRAREPVVARTLAERGIARRSDAGQQRVAPRGVTLGLERRNRRIERLHAAVLHRDLQRGREQVRIRA